MDLELSEEQAELRDNFRSVLEDCCPPALVRGVYEDGDEGDALWQQQVELGWPSCLLYTSPSPRDRTRSRMPSSA